MDDGPEDVMDDETRAFFNPPHGQDYRDDDPESFSAVDQGETGCH